MTGFLVLPHSYYNLTDAVWCGYSNLCTTIKCFACLCQIKLATSKLVCLCVLLIGGVDGRRRAIFLVQQEKILLLVLGSPNASQLNSGVPA